MKTYEFTIIIGGVDPQNDDQMRKFEDKFFEAGGDDATISSIDNTMLAEFTRTAVDAEHALFDAMARIYRSDAKVLHVLPGFIDDTATLQACIDRAGAAVEQMLIAV